MPVAERSEERAALLGRLHRLCHEGRAEVPARAPAVATGFPSLDAVLPGGGWPAGAVTELLAAEAGIGELSLVLPALRQLAKLRHIVFIAPPHLPYAPALWLAGLPLARLWLLQDVDVLNALWASEQLLRCPQVGAVLTWCAHLDERRVRRLQLAAESGGTFSLLYRPASAARQASPAALRLRLQAQPHGLQVEILKARGGHAHALVVHPAAATAA